MLTIITLLLIGTAGAVAAGIGISSTFLNLRYGLYRFCVKDLILLGWHIILEGIFLAIPPACYLIIYSMKHI